MHRLNTSWLRIACILAASALLVPPWAACADMAPDARALGIAESMLKYCARVDAADTGRWRQRVKEIATGASEAAVAKTRMSKEYRAGYASVSEFVGKVASQNAKRACAVPMDRGKSTVAQSK